MNNPFISVFKKVWEYADREQRRKILLIYFAFFMANLLLSISPILLGLFINELQAGKNTITTTWYYAIAFLSVVLLQWLIYGPCRIVERKLAFAISQNFLTFSFHRLLHFPIGWHSSEHTGAVNNRLRKAYMALKSFMETGNIYFRVLCDAIFSIVALLYFSPFFGTIAIILGMAAVSLNLKFDKPFMKALREKNEEEHKVMAGLSDNISNIKTIIILRLQGAMSNKVLESLSRMFTPFLRSVLINEWRWFTVNLLVTLTYLIVIVGFVYEQYDPGEVFYVGTLITLVGFLGNFTDTFYSITVRYTEVLRFHTDMQTVKEIESLSYQEVSDNVSGTRLPWTSIRVQIENFHHRVKAYTKPESGMASEITEGNELTLVDSPSAINNINLHLKRGQRIALIGDSGSGKTTILNLMRGLYHPQTYRLTIDDENHEWIALTRLTLLVPQDAEIFENTIHYNLTLGLSFSDEQVRQACGLACFSEVVGRLSDGFNSIVSEKGVNLSGGEKQRLGLARGILHQPDRSILLLDEPTSSTDTDTSHQIFANIKSLLSEKTIICSIHNLEFLKHFDYVYKFAFGRMVSHGPASLYLKRYDVADINN